MKGRVIKGEPDNMPDNRKAQKEAMKNNTNVGKGLLTGVTWEASTGGGGGGTDSKGNSEKGSVLQGLDLSGGGCSSLASASLTSASSSLLSSSSKLASLNSVVIDETDLNVLASLGVNATDTTTERGDAVWDSTNAPAEDERV